MLNQLGHHYRRVGMFTYVLELCVLSVLTILFAVALCNMLVTGDSLGNAVPAVAPVTSLYCIDVTVKSNEVTYADVKACQMSDGTASDIVDSTSKTLHSSVESSDGVLTLQIWDTTSNGLSRAYTVSSENEKGVNVVSHKLSKQNYHELTFVLRSN